MLYYNRNNKMNSRKLRNNLTDAEQKLWSYIRRKQIKGVQFYRQKPLGNYIVDFYAPSIKMIIEIDGGQHFEEIHIKKDFVRDLFFTNQGLKVLRFDNMQILETIDEVLEVIFDSITQ